MEILQDMPLALDADSLLAALHLRPGSDDAEEFGQLFETIRRQANPKALYRVSYIERLGNDRVAIDGVTFTSRVLRANLDKIERVFPFVATCGREIDELDLGRG